MKQLFLILFLTSISTLSFSQQKTVYTFEILEEIDAPAWRKTKLSIEEAEKIGADYILLHLDTYGGRVDFADSIRSKILSATIPTLVYIENNAASAGALISIACDSIYMSPGSTIGAATVVDQDGNVAPEKYQSFFRGKMRATAIENNRNPSIAEAMVDPKIAVENIVDNETLITFTVDEAIEHHYCEGKVSSIPEALMKAGIADYKLVEHKVTAVEKIIMLLINPAVSGLLIMLIMGGLYFEFQSPGIGFPGAIAVIGACLFFAPHYLYGLVDNFEIIIIFIGLLLVLLEVFVIPGFGIAGIGGGILIFAGLAFSLIGQVPTDYGFSVPDFSRLTYALSIVIVATSSGLFISIYLSSKLIQEKGAYGQQFVLTKTQKDEKISLENNISFQSLVGSTGTTSTPLRPAGKIIIDDKQYDAISSYDFIESGVQIKVVSTSNSQLKVVELG
ncbi:MAG: membrane-bound serine protease (ClpP class) [Saprospiraceae bacterium]|jgi:membrane-bound serine protease (ClpP class)